MPRQATRELITHLLNRLHEVRHDLGMQQVSIGADALFAEMLDSMGMVEFIMVLAHDLSVTPEMIEQCVDHRFGTVAELADALDRAGISPKQNEDPQAWPLAVGKVGAVQDTSWLAATAMRLPDAREPAAALNQALLRPMGWLERHAGILERRVWATQDPLAAAADAARECLERTGLSRPDVGALLVTSEAPPILAGLAAAVHHRLELPKNVVALEVGSACTGFLAALWTAQRLLPRLDVILVVAVEAATRLLQLQPGPGGEAAALFGDGAAATLLSRDDRGREAVRLGRICTYADGSLGGLLQIARTGKGEAEVQMSGFELASRAVEVMAQSVRDLADQHDLKVPDLAAVVAHGGNGRLPALLARKLDLPAEKVWSETPTTGNLGSASLPVAWAAHQPVPSGPVIWTAVGAGLTWGAALLGDAFENRDAAAR